MKESYSVLGLTPDSSEEELKAKYEELKRQYGEERFLYGEAGNEGARKLMELEDAWVVISADIQRRSYKTEGSGAGTGDFAEADSLIKAGKYDEAQKILDDITVRTAQWHYLQSIIYYKRDWLTESRKQLAMAVSMEPGNSVYSDALAKLDAVIGNPNVKAENLGGADAQPRPQQDDPANMLCRCCQAYICADCCCSLLGCCR